MNRTITNDNIHLILPGKVTYFVERYVRDHTNVDPLEALRVFYRSNTYKLLEKEESKLWHYGPVALYEVFLEIH